MFVAVGDGIAKAGDDALTAQWVDLDTLHVDDFNQSHKPLFVDWINLGQSLIEKLGIK